MGKYFYGGSLWGFIVAFIIKTPIPFLAFLFFTGWVVLRQKSIFFKNQFFIWGLSLIIFVTTAICAISLHLKYILPVYPLLCICISQMVNFDVVRKAKWRAGLILLCLWYAGSALWIHPYYLSYFNELIGGPSQGYKYLVDSNLDWGQDLKLLKNYLEMKGIIDIKLAYFGTGNPGYYGIRYEKLKPFSLSKGIIVISATYLQSVHEARGSYDWLKCYAPIARIGYTMFVYNIK